MQWTIYHLLYWKILLLEKLKLNTVLVKSGIFLFCFFLNKLFFYSLKIYVSIEKNKIWYCSVYPHIKEMNHKWIKSESLKRNYDTIDQFFLYCIFKCDSRSLFKIFRSKKLIKTESFFIFFGRDILFSSKWKLRSSISIIISKIDKIMSK